MTSTFSKSATAYLGLGSNLGDRLATMRATVEALSATPRIRIDISAGVSSLYETAPVGPAKSVEHQPPYLNSVVRIDTTLSPRDLLGNIMALETSLGRVRVRRWSARTIDVDLLLYDNLVLSEEGLTLPHPRMHCRRFVLAPLAEIAPRIAHPRTGQTIETLAAKALMEHPDDSVAPVMDSRWVAGTEQVASLSSPL